MKLPGNWLKKPFFSKNFRIFTSKALLLQKRNSFVPNVSAVSRAILNPAYRLGIPNSVPQTLKRVDVWSKLSSPFVVAEPRERCFEQLRMQNSQNFPGLCPWAPCLPRCTTVFLLATLVEKPVPLKTAGYNTEWTLSLLLKASENRKIFWCFQG